MIIINIHFLLFTVVRCIVISKKICRLGLLSTVAIGLNAFAKDTKDIEEIVVVGEMSNYSALKSDTPIMEVARSVSIETREEIEEKGALSLDDALAYSAGVFTDVFGYATRGDWAKVRGLQVPQYQDSLQSLFGNYNNSRPEIYTLEQVEILKGPASVLFGKGSPGGIINVISKRPKEEVNNEIVAEIGSFSRRQLSADFTGPIAGSDQFFYRLVAVKRVTDSQVDQVEENTLVLMPSISYHPTDRTKLTLLANYRNTKSDTGAQFLPIEGTLLPSPNGKKIASNSYMGIPGFNRYNPETKSFTFLANHEFNDMLSMEFTARSTKGEVAYRQAWPAFIGRAFGNNERFLYLPGVTPLTLYKDGTVPRTIYESNAKSDQLAMDLRFRAGFSTGLFEHSMLFGIQRQDVELSSNNVYLAAPGIDAANPSNNDDTFWVNVFNPVNSVGLGAAALDLIAAGPSYKSGSKDIDTGFYISDQITFDAWNISLGLRHDKVKNTNSVSKRTQKDSATSFSAGVLHEFESGVSPYINYAQSFEPVIGDNGDKVNPPKALKPKEAEQVEVGVKYQADNNKIILTAALFDIDITNLDDPNAAPNKVNQQSGTSNLKGVEIEGKLALTDTLKLEMNLTKLEAKDPKRKKLTSAVEEQVSSWLSYEALDSGLKAGLGVRYNGKVYGGKYTSFKYPNGVEVYAPSHTLVDAMLGYETPTWEATLNAKNLTDKEYYSSCLGRGDCFPGKERSLVAKLKYKFQ